MKRFRSETRTPVNLRGELAWDIGGGYVRHVKVVIRDTSKSGMAIAAPLPFSIGATVQITSTHRSGAAIVRHCLKRGADHILGVQFENTDVDNSLSVDAK
jgi:hypothetical protein